MSTEEIQLLKDEVKELKATVETLLERINDDSDIHTLAARLEEYILRSESAGSAAVVRVDSTLRSWGDFLYKNFRAELFNEFSKDVAEVAATQVTAEVIAESLTKKVLVVRPAARHEMANAVVTRPASKLESESGKRQ
jgi:predicted hydrocarbon binding protein